MEFLSAQFFSALLAIIVIDLMLAGDNAIVIALAARNVPKHMQKRAILWGMFGAIAVRISMTLAVVWLLQIPGLLFVGGAMLVWIACRLLLPDENGDDGEHVKAASSFWGAMKTIVVADAIMGLDNVLGVAGAAHGSFALVVVGLLISVPIVIWGSSVILGYVERYPGIVYFGAGVLAWTAAKMMVSEPLLKGYLAYNGVIVPVVFAAVVSGVLWFGFVRNHHWLESRIGTRLAEFSRQRQESMGGVEAGAEQPEKAVQRILVPVNGSPNALFAVRHVINEFKRHADMEIHLFNVQPFFSRYVARFVARKNRDNWHQEQAEKALAPCMQLLDQHGIPYSTHVEKGVSAEVIVAAAKRLVCDLIVMSTARKNSLTRMMEASVTNQVLELTSVPVEVISGDAVSDIEQYGIPVAIGVTIAVLALLAVY
jgi:YjbE family integral membrane protein